MKQVTEHLYQISLGAVNVFVIEENESLTLIDCGYENSADKIFKAIKKAGKDPQNIKQLILTHTHPDHAGSAAEIKRRLNIPVLAHFEDAKLMEQGIAGRLPFVLSPGFVNWLVFNLFIKGSRNRIEPLKTDQLLHDKDILPIAGGLQVIYSPGHSLGHIALYHKKDDVLIAGDICANVFGLGLSPVYENRETGIKSILKVTATGFEKAVFGHGNPIFKGASTKMRHKFAR